MNMKFNEAALWENGKYKLVEIETLFELKENHEAEFNLNYASNLYCPVCKKAKLSLTYGNQRKYLSANSTESHESHCDYFFKRAPINVLIKYASEIKSNPQEVQNNLQRLLNESTKKNEISIVNLSIDAQKSVNKPITYTEAKSRVVYHIPRQKIGRENGDVFEEDISKFYHGRVGLKKIIDDDRGWVNLRLYNIYTKELICSLGIYKGTKKDDNPAYVWLYLQETIENLVDTQYDIAFFGAVTKNQNFNNIIITHSDFILIREI